MATCATSGCENPAKTRGLCNKHYLRWWKAGLPGGTSQAPWVRVVNKIDASGDCWEWLGGHNELGYGVGPSTLAHRDVWQLLVGRVPDGYELDHLCRNPGCVKPDHLEVVTHAENMRRSPFANRWRPCSVPSCPRRAKSRGWCNTHYERWRLTGSVDADVAVRDVTRNPPVHCTEPGCEKPHRAKGLCSTHYARLTRKP